MTHLLEAITNLKEFDYYNKFSLSPDQSMLAYVVRHKPPEFHLTDLESDNGTPYNLIGCELWLADLISNKTQKICEQNSWRPSWSRDGSTLAFYSDKNGYPQLWIYLVSEQKIKLACSSPVRALFSAFDKSCWDINNNIIYFPMDIHPTNQKKPIKNEMKSTIISYTTPIYGNQNLEEKPCDEYCLADIAKFDLQNNKMSLLISHDHPSKPAFIIVSDSGNFLSYLSSPTPAPNPAQLYTSLWIFSVKNNSRPQLIDSFLEVHSTLLHLPYLWIKNQDKIIYIKNEKLFLNDLTIGKNSNKIIFESDKIKLSEDFFQANSNNILIVSIKTPNQITSLLVLNLDKPDNNFIINLDKYQKYSDIRDVLLTDSNQLIILTQDNNNSETIYLKFDVNDITKFEANNLSYCHLTDLINFKNSDIACYYENPSKIGEIALVDNKLNIINSITHINSDITLPTYSLKTVTTSLKTSIGKEIKVRTTVLLPSDAPKAAIIYLYPGLLPSKYTGEFGGSLSTSAFPHLLFLEKGYAVILPDMPLNYEGINNLLDEFLSLLYPQLQNACAQFNLDENNLGIMGHSFGGYATAGILCKTNLFKAAVAISGIYDLGGSYGFIDDKGFFFQRKFIEDGQCRMGHPPWDNIQHYLENSPYYLADKITTPLFLLHGGKDQTCPAVESEKLFTALDRLGKKAELLIYKEEEHVPREWIQTNYFCAADRIINFLDSKLKTKCYLSNG